MRRKGWFAGMAGAERALTYERLLAGRLRLLVL
jgi:hypothetical protein